MAVLWSTSPAIKAQHYADVLLPSLMAIGKRYMSIGIISIFKGKSQLTAGHKMFNDISLKSAL